METVTTCVNPWLQQRGEILITLNNLAGLLPNTLHKDPVCLTNFFQLLIDYTCAGHLQIFTLLVKQDSEKFISTKKILEKINDTTNTIIKINYKFNKFKNISANDIRKLLEQFANRIELEDLLLDQATSIDKNYIN